MGNKVSNSEIAGAEVSDKAKEKCVVYTTSDSKTCTLRVSEDVQDPTNVYTLSLRDYTFDTKGTTLDMKFIKTKKSIITSNVTHRGNSLQVYKTPPGCLCIMYGGPNRIAALVVRKHEVDGEEESPIHLIKYFCISHISSKRISVVAMVVLDDNHGKGRLRSIILPPSWHPSVSKAEKHVNNYFKLEEVITSSDDDDDDDDRHQKAITGGIDLLKNQGSFNGDLNGSIFKTFVFNLHLTK